MVAAVLLDLWWGELARAHPLVAFGRLVSWIERHTYADRRAAGMLAWAIAVLPIVLLVWLAQHLLPCASALATLVLYLALGLRSLDEHARPVADALANDHIVLARAAVGRMVSRDTHALDATKVAAAATESVLENGNDAVFGALFWFVLLGAPGVVLFRLANTLDAMWGYRTERFNHFGWAAARIDDVLNFVPARITAFTYALFGHYRDALHCWRTQAPLWDSPNAGPVMAAGAGALGVQLGGTAPYHGVWEERPMLGLGAMPDSVSIIRALRLVRHGVMAWLAVILLLAIASWMHGHA